MNSDPQGESYKRTLSDIKERKIVDTSFSKEESRSKLKQSSDKFSDYPTEMLIIAVLAILVIFLLVSNAL